MTLNELITAITELALTHTQIKAVQTGNTFDIATSKSSEVYPSLWLELPILINYNDLRKKTYTFALNFVTLVKRDDLADTILKTSDMEAVADDMLQALKLKYKNISTEDISGLTLRNFSDDDLSGVRVELTFGVGRECDVKDNFNQPL